MRLLLDTNALLWMATGHERITPVMDMLVDPAHDVYVSAVSWWEIAIKNRIGKLDVVLPDLRNGALENGFLELPLYADTAEVLRSLPEYHKDPFDHMLIAQAISESMYIITGDNIFAKYTDLAIVI